MAETLYCFTVYHQLRSNKLLIDNNFNRLVYIFYLLIEYIFVNYYLFSSRDMHRIVLLFTRFFFSWKYFSSLLSKMLPRILFHSWVTKYIVTRSAV